MNRDTIRHIAIYNARQINFNDYFVVRVDNCVFPAATSMASNRISLKIRTHTSLLTFCQLTTSMHVNRLTNCNTFFKEMKTGKLMTSKPKLMKLMSSLGSLFHLQTIKQVRYALQT